MGLISDVFRSGIKYNTYIDICLSREDSQIDFFTQSILWMLGEGG